MLSRSSVTKSNLGPRVYLKVAKTLSPLCYSPPHRNKRKVFSVQPTSSIPILLIMLSGQHRCTSVQLLVSIGYPLLGLKITKPSLTSSSHPSRLPPLFISLITICHGSSALMPLIMLWVLSCSKSTLILLVQYIYPLPLLLTSFQVQLLIGTRSNKKPMLFIMQ